MAAKYETGDQIVAHCARCRKRTTHRVVLARPENKFIDTQCSGCQTAQAPSYRSARPLKTATLGIEKVTRTVFKTPDGVEHTSYTAAQKCLSSARLQAWVYENYEEFGVSAELNAPRLCELLERDWAMTPREKTEDAG